MKFEPRSRSWWMICWNTRSDTYFNGLRCIEKRLCWAGILTKDASPNYIRLTCVLWAFAAVGKPRLLLWSLVCNLWPITALLVGIRVLELGLLTWHANGHSFVQKSTTRIRLIACNLLGAVRECFELPEQQSACDLPCEAKTSWKRYFNAHLYFPANLTL